MQILIDFLPVVAFVAAYWLADFNTAVLVIMVAVVIQAGVTWLLKGTVNRLLLASAGLVVVLGGGSLLLDNDLIFKWKPTVLNWVFGLVFLGSQFIGERTIVQRLMESLASEQFQLQRRDWVQLNMMWVVFFMVSGIANIVVAYMFSEAFWVNFKLFGLMGMTLVFVVIQAIWLNNRLGPDKEEPGEQS
ncbi:MAG: septation protein IspZ [Chromatiales bacterium]|nr:septation protein IspZ [Chromatiales bacterium]